MTVSIKLWGFFLNAILIKPIWDNVSSKHKIYPIYHMVFQFLPIKIVRFQSSSSSAGYQWLNETEGKYAVYGSWLEITREAILKVYFFPLFDPVWLTLNTDVTLLLCVCTRVYIHVNAIQCYKVKLQRKHFSPLIKACIKPSDPITSLADE